MSSVLSTKVVVAQIALILAHKCRFGTTLSSPLTDDAGQWGARVGIQPIVFLLLDPIAANLDRNLPIMASAATSATASSAASAVSTSTFVDTAPTTDGLTRLEAEPKITTPWLADALMLRFLH